jgi:azurin
MSSQDLHVAASCGDLRLVVVHEGQSGNTALAQATVMQVIAEWPGLTADALEKGMLDVFEEAEDEAEVGEGDAS